MGTVRWRSYTGGREGGSRRQTRRQRRARGASTGYRRAPVRATRGRTVGRRDPQRRLAHDRAGCRRGHPDRTAHHARGARRLSDPARDRPRPLADPASPARRALGDPRPPQATRSLARACKRVPYRRALREPIVRRRLQAYRFSGTPYRLLELAVPQQIGTRCAGTVATDHTFEVPVTRQVVLDLELLAVLVR